MIDDARWAELRCQFTEAELIELTAHTTLYIRFARFNEIVGRDADRRAYLERIGKVTPFGLGTPSPP